MNIYYKNNEIQKIYELSYNDIRVKNMNSSRLKP